MSLLFSSCCSFPMAIGGADELAVLVIVSHDVVRVSVLIGVSPGVLRVRSFFYSENFFLLAFDGKRIFGAPTFPVVGL